MLAKLIKNGDVVPSRSEFTRSATIHALETILLDGDTSFLSREQIEPGKVKEVITLNLLKRHVKVIDELVENQLSPSRSAFARDAIRLHVKRQRELRDRIENLQIVTESRPAKKKNLSVIKFNYPVKGYISWPKK